ncbi:MAG: CPBP family intramembrane metalloprotease [Ruminococcus sp.]|uniref:CPBP family intramembrane glutamic endopeptidase n=1 Tax=Ruminococcus sp. TaxID=41978 RepID=UPI001B0C20DC|nr:CPBP family intramembrane glutamic endopeptidase [Ruminococcus sp.]MBO7473559.1 CPBP family intramembrane metalloprotease [Ruminococcus sp.]
MSKVRKYLLFTFISSWIIQVIGCRDLGHNNMAGAVSFSYALSFCMLMPTLGAFFSKADVGRMGWRPNITKNIKLILFAWLMPTVFQIAGAALYYLVFSDDIAHSGEYLRDVDCEAFEECVRTGSSYGMYIAKEIFYSLTSFYTCFGVFLGLGEEIGWRGFLYPELKNRFGKAKGLLLGGTIHGVWHFPLILLAGYEYGTRYIGAPLLGLFAFCVFTVTTGIISDWLYVKSGSIWLPAIIHSTTNTTFNPCMLRGTGHLERSVLGPMDIGLIAIIPMAIFAAGLIYIDYRRKIDVFEEF